MQTEALAPGAGQDGGEHIFGGGEIGQVVFFLKCVILCPHLASESLLNSPSFLLAPRNGTSLQRYLVSQQRFFLPERASARGAQAYVPPNTSSVGGGACGVLGGSDPNVCRVFQEMAFLKMWSCATCG